MIHPLSGTVCTSKVVTERCLGQIVYFKKMVIQCTQSFHSGKKRLLLHIEQSLECTQKYCCGLPLVLR